MKLKVGEKVKIKTDKVEYVGIVTHDNDFSSDSLIIKLNSGYKIGIKKDKIKSIEKFKVVDTKKDKEINLKFNELLPQISLVSTGGTITSKVNYKTGGVFPYETPNDILLQIPEIKNIVNIKKIKQIMSNLSENIAPRNWIEIAKEVYKELKEDVKGVIITHGTDTLHYTSAALSFMFKNLNKPIALVGAQRSVDRGSFDGHLNILCAANYCLTDIAEVSVVMHANINDEYCIAIRGTKARKMHSSRRDAFRPINDFPIAKIWPDGNIIIESEYRRRSNRKIELVAKFDEMVALQFIYPGIKPEILKYYIDKGYRGVIIAGTGFGHVPIPTEKRLSWEDTIRAAINSGLFIGITTQTIYGRVNGFVYSTGRVMQKLGVVFLRDMLPEVAYVKLGWVFGQTKNFKKVKDMMLKNVAGEFNNRLNPETFLY